MMNDFKRPTSRAVRTGLFAAIGVAFVLSVCWIFPAVVRAADDDIDYVPPVKASSSKRIGGASRGGNSQIYVCILAPKTEVGQTTKAQPAIYWYLSDSIKGSIEIGLTPIDPATAKESDTVLDLMLKGPHKAGLHKLDLAKPAEGKAPTLDSSKQYKLVVEILDKEVNASGNPSASCRMARVAPPEELAGKIKGASPAQQAGLYAKLGIWYDAIDSLNQALDAGKDDKELTAKLLKSREKMLKTQGFEQNEKGEITDPVGAAARTEEHHH